MQAAVATNPDIVQGAPDLNIRRGINVGDDRTIISYAQYRSLMSQPDGPTRVRKFAVVMRAPSVDQKGRILKAGGGEAAAMPAEKYIKWYGQHYRPTVSTTDHELYEEPAPPEPTRWVPSMVEDAIAAGLPIPRELKPAGYAGPVFDIDAPTVAEGAAAPEIFRCDASECSRFFDSAQGLAMHKSKEHRE